MSITLHPEIVRSGGRAISASLAQQCITVAWRRTLAGARFDLPTAEDASRHISGLIDALARLEVLRGLSGGDNMLDRLSSRTMIDLDDELESNGLDTYELTELWMEAGLDRNIAGRAAKLLAKVIHQLLALTDGASIDPLLDHQSHVYPEELHIRLLSIVDHDAPLTGYAASLL